MPYKLQTNLAAINGGVDYALLAGKDDLFSYDNGRRTSDTPIGVKLTLALQNSHLSTLSVKFPSDPLPKVSDEAIAEACSTCHFMYVQVPDCNVNLFSGENGIGMSATANSARIVNLKE